MCSDNRYSKRTIHKITLASRHLGQDRRIRVFVPPGYDKRRPHPIVYCQDGEQFFNFGRIVTHALRLIADERLDPMIIVGIDVDKRTRTSEYSPDGERFAAYGAFMSEELMPHIESRYAVAADGGGGRVLAGCSLGAAAALHLALDRPDLSGCVMSLSGAFGEPTLRRLAAPRNLDGMRLYMIVGKQETAVDTDRGTLDFVRLNREASRLLVAHGASVTYREYEGTHTWGFWQRHIPEALTLFFGRGS